MESVDPRLRRTRRAVVVAMVSSLLGLPPPGTASATCAQYVREYDGIPLIDSLGPAVGAWRGGWQNARPQLLDVEPDGDLDLFVAETDGQLRFFRNDGDADTPDFTLVTDRYVDFHGLYFTRFVDLDSDGDWDLFTQAPDFTAVINGSPVLRPGAYLVTNVGTGADPEWLNLSAHPQGYLVDEDGVPIPFATTSPDFVDLDADGDLDLMFGDPTGSIILYRNVGDPFTPQFRFETDRYRNLTIVFGACNPELPSPVSLDTLLRANRPDPRHGFMLFTFHDLNHDSLPDMFVGDQFNPNVYHLLNLGGAPSPDFSCQTQNFFPNEFGGNGFFSQYLVTAFGDLDNDGDDDALMGSGTGGADGLYYFRNDGSVPQAPFMVQMDDDYLPELDGGSNSVPALADLDGDLDLDLYVGFGSSQRIAYYENIGSPTSPEFAEINSTWMNLPNAAWAAPEFADLDDDGDTDLLLGMTSGAVRYFRNDGTPTSATFTEILDDAAFGDFSDRLFRQNVDAQASPCLLDLDGDGDLDLVMGYFDFGGEATLMLFRNDGTPAAHAFVLASTDFQGLGVLGQNLVPEAGDVDGDGDLDLLVGRFDGHIDVLRNVATVGAPYFVMDPAPLDVDVGATATPHLADIDADGDADLFLGESAGGLNFLRREGPVANPDAFVLQLPAPDEEIDGRTAYRFDWDSSDDPETGSEVTEYRLILSPSPGAPPDQWRVIDGLIASEASVIVHTEDFRFLDEIWWTVSAGEECRPAPMPEWSPFIHTTPDVDIPPPPAVGAGFAISNLYPSPATPAMGDATIELVLPSSGRVKVRVLDTLGRHVRTLQNGPLEAGIRLVLWDGTDSEGQLVSAGVYFVHAQFGEREVSRRIVRLR